MRIELYDDARTKIGLFQKLSQSELAWMKHKDDSLIDSAFIRPSIIPCGSPVLLASKKDGGLRIFIEYLALKEHSINIKYLSRKLMKSGIK